MCPASKKRQIRGCSRSGNARRLAQLFRQLFVERPHLFVLRVRLRRRQIDRSGQNMFWAEAWIGTQDSLEAAHQQSRAYEQHYRERAFDDQKKSAKRTRLAPSQLPA